MVWGGGDGGSVIRGCYLFCSSSWNLTPVQSEGKVYWCFAFSPINASAALCFLSFSWNFPQSFRLLFPNVILQGVPSMTMNFFPSLLFPVEGKTESYIVDGRSTALKFHLLL
jgi:hypothetical protein